MAMITVCYNIRVDSRLAPSQWETSLQRNIVSHWLSANLESALNFGCTKTFSAKLIPQEISLAFCNPIKLSANKKRGYKCNAFFHWLLLKRNSYHFDKIFIAVCTSSCQNDNFLCSQWWNFCQSDYIPLQWTPCAGAAPPHPRSQKLMEQQENLKVIVRSSSNPVWFVIPGLVITNRSTPLYKMVLYKPPSDVEPSPWSPCGKLRVSRRWRHRYPHDVTWMTS